MIAAVIFHVRPGIEEQTTWLDGEPTSDPFMGIPRDVIGGGLGIELPEGRGQHQARPVAHGGRRAVPAPSPPGPRADRRRVRHPDDLLVAGDGDDGRRRTGQGGALRHADPAGAGREGRRAGIRHPPRQERRRRGGGGLVVAGARRGQARLRADRAAGVRQDVRQPRRRQQRDGAQRRAALRAVRRPPEGVRDRHPRADHSELRRAGRARDVRRRHHRPVHGLQRQALRPLPVRDRRRAAAHVHHPDDVLPVGLPAAEGDPDEPRLDPRDLRRARPDLPARLGLGPVPVRPGGRDRRGHAGDRVRDPLRPVDRLRSVHALADQGVLQRDAATTRSRWRRGCSTPPASSPPPA